MFSIVDRSNRVRWDVVKAWFRSRWHVYKTQREFQTTTRLHDKSSEWRATFANRGDALNWVVAQELQAIDAAARDATLEQSGMAEE